MGTEQELVRVAVCYTCQAISFPGIGFVDKCCMNWEGVHQTVRFVEYTAEELEWYFKSESEVAAKGVRLMETDAERAEQEEEEKELSERMEPDPDFWDPSDGVYTISLLPRDAWNSVRIHHLRLNRAAAECPICAALGEPFRKEIRVINFAGDKKPFIWSAPEAVLQLIDKVRTDCPGADLLVKRVSAERLVNTHYIVTPIRRSWIRRLFRRSRSILAHAAPRLSRHSRIYLWRVP